MTPETKEKIIAQYKKAKGKLSNVHIILSVNTPIIKSHAIAEVEELKTELTELQHLLNDLL